VDAIIRAAGLTKRYGANRGVEAVDLAVEVAFGAGGGRP
jgi:hypothetical protein